MLSAFRIKKTEAQEARAKERLENLSVALADYKEKALKPSYIDYAQLKPENPLLVYAAEQWPKSTSKFEFYDVEVVEILTWLEKALKTLEPECEFTLGYNTYCLNVTYPVHMRASLLKAPETEQHRCLLMFERQQGCTVEFHRFATDVIRLLEEYYNVLKEERGASLLLPLVLDTNSTLEKEFYDSPMLEPALLPLLLQYAGLEKKPLPLKSALRKRIGSKVGLWDIVPMDTETKENWDEDQALQKHFYKLMMQFSSGFQPDWQGLLSNLEAVLQQCSPQVLERIFNGKTSNETYVERFKEKIETAYRWSDKGRSIIGCLQILIKKGYLHEEEALFETVMKQLKAEERVTRLKTFELITVWLEKNEALAVRQGQALCEVLRNTINSIERRNARHRHKDHEDDFQDADEVRALLRANPQPPQAFF